MLEVGEEESPIGLIGLFAAGGCWWCFCMG
jgi:hypothetical protein